MRITSWLIALGSLPLAQTSLAEGHQLSELTYTVNHDANDLSCLFVPGNGGGYLRYDYAVATLNTASDFRPVMVHQQAELSPDSLGGGIAPRTLCARIAQIKDDARNNGGRIAVEKRVVLSVLTFPSYEPSGCSRQLQETVHAEVAEDVVLSSYNGKRLSATQEDCFAR